MKILTAVAAVGVGLTAAADPRPPMEDPSQQLGACSGTDMRAVITLPLAAIVTALDRDPTREPNSSPGTDLVLSRECLAFLRTAEAGASTLCAAAHAGSLRSRAAAMCSMAKLVETASRSVAALTPRSPADLQGACAADLRSLGNLDVNSFPPEPMFFVSVSERVMEPCGVCLVLQNRRNECRDFCKENRPFSDSCHLCSLVKSFAITARCILKPTPAERPSAGISARLPAGLTVPMGGAESAVFIHPPPAVAIQHPAGSQVDQSVSQTPSLPNVVHSAEQVDPAAAKIVSSVNAPIIVHEPVDSSACSAGDLQQLGSVSVDTVARGELVTNAMSVLLNHLQSSAHDGGVTLRCVAALHAQRELASNRCSEPPHFAQWGICMAATVPASMLAASAASEIDGACSQDRSHLTNLDIAAIHACMASGDGILNCVTAHVSLECRTCLRARNTEELGFCSQTQSRRERANDCVELYRFAAIAHCLVAAGSPPRAASVNLVDDVTVVIPPQGRDRPPHPLPVSSQAGNQATAEVAGCSEAEMHLIARAPFAAIIEETNRLPFDFSLVLQRHLLTTPLSASCLVAVVEAHKDSGSYCGRTVPDRDQLASCILARAVAIATAAAPPQVTGACAGSRSRRILSGRNLDMERLTASMGRGKPFLKSLSGQLKRHSECRTCFSQWSGRPDACGTVCGTHPNRVPCQQCRRLDIFAATAHCLVDAVGDATASHRRQGPATRGANRLPIIVEADDEEDDAEEEEEEEEEEDDEEAATGSDGTVVDPSELLPVGRCTVKEMRMIAAMDFPGILARLPSHATDGEFVRALPNVLWRTSLSEECTSYLLLARLRATQGLCDMLFTSVWSRVRCAYVLPIQLAAKAVPVPFVPSLCTGEDFEVLTNPGMVTRIVVPSHDGSLFAAVREILSPRCGECFNGLWPHSSCENICDNRSLIQCDACILLTRFAVTANCLFEAHRTRPSQRGVRNSPIDGNDADDNGDDEDAEGGSEYEASRPIRDTDCSVDELRLIAALDFAGILADLPGDATEEQFRYALPPSISSRIRSTCLVNLEETYSGSSRHCRRLFAARDQLACQLIYPIAMAAALIPAPLTPSSCTVEDWETVRQRGVEMADGLTGTGTTVIAAVSQGLSPECQTCFANWEARNPCRDLCMDESDQCLHCVLLTNFAITADCFVGTPQWLPSDVVSAEPPASESPPPSIASLQPIDGGAGQGSPDRPPATSDPRDTPLGRSGAARVRAPPGDRPPISIAPSVDLIPHSGDSAGGSIAALDYLGAVEGIPVVRQAADAGVAAPVDPAAGGAAPTALGDAASADAQPSGDAPAPVLVAGLPLVAGGDSTPAVTGISTVVTGSLPAVAGRRRAPGHRTGGAVHGATRPDVMPLPDLDSPESVPDIIASLKAAKPITRKSTKPVLDRDVGRDPRVGGRRQGGPRAGPAGRQTIRLVKRTVAPEVTSSSAPSSLGQSAILSLIITIATIISL